MARNQEASASWIDLAQCVTEWEDEYGVDLVLAIHTRRGSGGVDLYVEAHAYDREEASTRPLHTVRQGLAVRRQGAPAKNLLYAAFSCLEQIDSTPWLWPTKIRRERVELD